MDKFIRQHKYHKIKSLDRTADCSTPTGIVGVVVFDNCLQQPICDDDMLICINLLTFTAVIYNGLFYLSFLIFIFYSGTDLSRYLSDRRNFFTDTRVMTQGCQRGSWISKLLLTYLTGCKKPLKNIFSRVFHWVTSRFRSLRKNGLC